jgi:hypothetical protein
MQRILSFISAVLVVATAPPLYANKGGPITSGGGGTVLGGGSGIFKFCPIPTVAYCTDRNSPNDANCWATAQSQCQQLVSNAFQQSYNNLTTGPTTAGGAPHGVFASVLPEGMTGGGQLTDNGHEFYDQRQVNEVDHDYNYLSTIRQAQKPTRFGSWALFNLTASPQPLHPDWEGRNEIDSCAEYVYKKYHDYSRFDDAAASCKEDYLCVVALALGTTSPGINFYPLREQDLAHDPMPLQVQVQEPAFVRPKNTFFAHQTQLTGDIPPALFSDVIVARGGSNAATVAAALSYLSATPYTITNRWAWHVQMYNSQRAENPTLQEYADMTARQQKYAQLVDSFLVLRNALQSLKRSADIMAILHPNVSTCGDVDILPNGGLYAPPSTWCSCNPAADPHCVCAPPPMPGSGLPGQTCQHPKPAGLPVWPSGSLQDQFQGVVQAMADMLIAEWDHVSAKDGATVDHGCLDPNSTRCDWAPKEFADYYQHRFEAEREHDFQYCLDTSNDNFTPQNYPQVLPADHADLAPWVAWMTNSAKVRGDLLKMLPTVKNSNGTSTIGRDFTGGKVLGDPSFAAITYNYGAGYAVTFGRSAPDKNGQRAICNAQGSVNGSAYAAIDLPAVPGGPAPHMVVVDAALDLRAGQNGAAGQSNAFASGHLTLFGNELYDSQGEVDIGQFNLAPAGSAPLSDGWGTDIFVPIAGVIPVTIHIGIDFSANFSWAATGNAPQGCQPDSPLFALHGQFTPSVSANATLSAALGISILGLAVEAGVRGDLALLQVGVPVDVNLGIAAVADDDNVIRTSLALDTQAHVALSALSGKVSAFAEVCPFVCMSVEKELFSWPGINLGSVPLFELKKNFPLVLLDGQAL